MLYSGTFLAIPLMCILLCTYYPQNYENWSHTFQGKTLENTCANGKERVQSNRLQSNWCTSAAVATINVQMRAAKIYPDLKSLVYQMDGILWRCEFDYFN